MATIIPVVMKKGMLFAMLASLVVTRGNNGSGKVFQRENLIDITKTKNQMIDNKSFTATILVNQKPSEAFNAIKNFRAWWSEEIEGNTDQLNEEFFYHYKDIHLCKMKLIQLIPDKR